MSVVFHLRGPRTAPCRRVSCLAARVKETVYNGSSSSLPRPGLYTSSQKQGGRGVTCRERAQKEVRGAASGEQGGLCHGRVSVCAFYLSFGDSYSFVVT